MAYSTPAWLASAVSKPCHCEPIQSAFGARSFSLPKGRGSQRAQMATGRIAGLSSGEHRGGCLQQGKSSCETIHVRKNEKVKQAQHIISNNLGLNKTLDFGSSYRSVGLNLVTITRRKYQQLLSAERIISSFVPNSQLKFSCSFRTLPISKILASFSSSALYGSNDALLSF